MKARTSICEFARWKAGGERFVCLTAYDAPTARILESSGVPMILVGDSVGNVVLGHALRDEVARDLRRVDPLDLHVGREVRRRVLDRLVDRGVRVTERGVLAEDAEVHPVLARGDDLAGAHEFLVLEVEAVVDHRDHRALALGRGPGGHHVRVGIDAARD